MANLEVEVTLSDGIVRLEIYIDEQEVEFDSDNKGTVDVDGACGDGSDHRLNYTIEGPAGDTVSVKVYCGDATVLNLEDIKIFPEAAPLAAGWAEFKL